MQEQRNGSTPTLTRDDIMRLGGRDLDAAVEAHVFRHASHVACGSRFFHRDHEAMADLIAHFDTAGQFRMRHGASGQWWATFGQPGDCQGSTAPEAAARAALCQVMGV